MPFPFESINAVAFREATALGGLIRPDSIDDYHGRPAAARNTGADVFRLSGVGDLSDRPLISRRFRNRLIHASIHAEG